MSINMAMPRCRHPPIRMSVSVHLPMHVCLDMTCTQKSDACTYMCRHVCIHVRRHVCRHVRRNVWKCFGERHVKFLCGRTCGTDISVARVHVALGICVVDICVGPYAADSCSQKAMQRYIRGPRPSAGKLNIIFGENTKSHMRWYANKLWSIRGRRGTSVFS